MNEFIIKNGLITKGNSTISGSLTVTGGITGSLQGTASYATQALSASYAPASSPFPYTGSAIISGSLILTGSLNVSGSTTQVGNNSLIGNTTLSGSLTISGNTIMTGSITALNLTASFGYVSASFVDITGKQTVRGYTQYIPTSDVVPISTVGGYVYSSGSQGDLYFAQTNGVENNVTRLRWIENNLYTGLLNGGVIKSASSAEYTVSSGSGIIVSLNGSLNTETYPTINFISWPNLSASIAPLSASYDQSFVAIQQSGSTGIIYTQGIPYDDGQFNTLIPIGNVIHQNHSTINAVATYPSVAYGYKQRSSDFIRAFGPLKLSGLNTIVSGSTTGSLQITSGTSYNEGRNYVTDVNNPSYVIDTGQPISKIYRYYQSGSSWVYLTNGGVGFETIDPTQYALNGVLTPVPGTGINREFSIQRVYYFPSGATKGIYVYYGNQTYATAVEAIANIPYESFTEAPNTAAGAILSAYLVVRNNADFTVPASYNIRPGGLFRNIGGSGGGGSAATQTLASLTDVNILTSPPTEGQPLVYNASTVKWNNSSTVVANLTGTSSYATNALSASYAATASKADTAYTTDKSTDAGVWYPTFVGSGSAGYQGLNFDSSFTYTPQKDLLQVTASYAKIAISASIAQTASYVPPSAIFPYTGSAAISGSLSIVNSGVEILNTTASLIKDINNKQSIDWKNRYLYDTFDKPSIWWDRRRTYDGVASESIDWGKRVLRNQSGTAILEWVSGSLIDASVKTSLDWNTRKLYDSSQTLSADWTTRILYDSQATPTASLDWRTRTTYDKYTSQSIDWDSRRLRNTAGSTILDWQNATFTGTASYATQALSASWAPGGGGSPGGSDTYVQFNNAGAFGGKDTFRFYTDSGSVTQGDVGNTAFGIGALATGKGTTATGSWSHAEGGTTQAIGDFAHAEGSTTQAIEAYSHAEGEVTKAIGYASHAEGAGSTANGSHSHAEGDGTNADGAASHAEGSKTNAIGTYSHAEGNTNYAYGIVSHTEGDGTQTGITTAYYADDITAGLVKINTSYGDQTGLFTQGSRLMYGSAAGLDNYNLLISGSFWDTVNTYVQLLDLTTDTSATPTIVAVQSDYFYNSISNNGGDQLLTGNDAHAEGTGTTAIGQSSHAEGYTTQAHDEASHAEGTYSEAIGVASHAEGNTTYAIGNSSHTEGESSIAIGQSSHAEGSSNTTGIFCHGLNTPIISGVFELALEYGDITSQFIPGNFVLINDSNGEITGVPTTHKFEIASVTYNATPATEISLVDISVNTVTSKPLIGQYQIVAPLYANRPIGEYSHAAGAGTQTYGFASNTAGQGTEALGFYQSVIGSYNIPLSDTSSFIIGDGYYDYGLDAITRHNLLVAGSGVVQITGSLQVSGSITGSLLGTVSSIVKGEATVNFGATPGSNYATTTISTPNVTNNSNIHIYIMSTASADHNAMEHQIFSLYGTVMPDNIIDNTSFDIVALSQLRLDGTFKVRYTINNN